MTDIQWQAESYKLYNAGQITNWPATEWIVQGVIQPDSLVVIFGQSRAGKSFLVLDLASKIANGEEWFEHQIKPRKVVYLAAEGIRGISSRIKAIEQTNENAIGNNNLMFACANIDLSNSEDTQNIIDTIYGKADVFIIDTLNAASPGSDENSSKDMGKIIHNVRKIICDCRCTVILVHHTGWDDKDRMRGHSSLSAAADTRIYVKQSKGTRQWSVTGQRDGELTNWKHFRLDPVTLKDSVTTSCVVTPIKGTTSELETKPEAVGANQLLIHEHAKQLIDENNGAPVSVDLLIEKVIPLIPAPSKHRSTRAKDSVAQLIKKGRIKVNELGYVIEVSG